MTQMMIQMIQMIQTMTKGEFTFSTFFFRLDNAIERLEQCSGTKRKIDQFLFVARKIPRMKKKRMKRLMLNRKSTRQIKIVKEKVKNRIYLEMIMLTMQ